MSEQRGEQLVTAAFQMAISSRRPKPGLPHHSDRGSQYTSLGYQALLKQHGIQVSMSRKGNCYDNAMMESFFGTLKEEGVEGRRFQSRQAARTLIFSYVETFYNRKRRHSSIGYISPVEYEKQQLWRKSEKNVDVTLSS